MHKNKDPLVSVIIPFLNEESFLEDAIKSVISQKYSNWEIILVDDGSKDRSTAIAKNYAAQVQGKIFYAEHENHANKGLSASRNEGIRKSRGEYIALLDADDVWLPAKLLEQIAIFQQYPDVGMIAEASLYWHSWSNKQEKDVLIPVGGKQDKIYEPAQLFSVLYPLADGAAPCPSGLILKREIFHHVGFFEESFRHEYGLYEDQAFLHKVYLKERVYISSLCNNLYRQRPGSIVKWVHQKGHYKKVRKYFLEWFKEYLRTKSFTNKDILKMINRELFLAKYPFFQYLFKTKKKVQKRLGKF